MTGAVVDVRLVGRTQEEVGTWRTVEVGDLGEFVNGYPFKPSEWTASHGDPIIRIQNLTDKSKPFNLFAGAVAERYRVHPGDLLISWSASLDAFLWNGPDAWLNQHIFKVTPNTDVVDRDFLYFLMKQEIRKIALSARGSTMKHVTGKIFPQHMVSLPTLDEQRRTAWILSAIQRAEQEAVIVEASARALRASLRTSFFDRGGFPLVELGTVSTIRSGGTPSRSESAYWNGDIPWVKTGEVDYGIIRKTGESITKLGLKNSSARIYPSGTILLAMYGDGVTRGKVAILGLDAAINQACAAIAPDERIDPDFLYQYLSHAYETIRSVGHGAHQKNLSAALVKRIPVPVPARSEQASIVLALAAADQKIDAEHRMMRSLNNLFVSALHSLLSPAETPT